MNSILNAQVVDRSLDVIKYNRDPTFTAAEVHSPALHS